MLSGLVEQAYDTILRLKQQELELEVNLGYTGRSCEKTNKEKKTKATITTKLAKAILIAKKKMV